MKILCPTDFSAPSRDGIEYAACMAQAMSGQLTLFHVQSTIWPEAMQLRNEVERGMEDISDELELFKNEVIDTFRIQCDWAVDRTTETIQGAIAKKSRQYDLVIMGTNGADNLYQYVFGSNSFKVIDESKCPVLVVPEGSHFRPLKRIVYAFDPEMNPIFLIDQLLAMAKSFHAEVVIVHVVTEKKSKETERQMEILRGALHAREKTDLHWQFDYEYSNDVSGTVDSYMRTSQSDLLAVSFHFRTVAQRLFRPNVIKRISMMASYPVLIIHR